LSRCEDPRLIVSVITVSQFIDRERREGILCKGRQHAPAACPVESRAAGTQDELDPTKPISVALALLSAVPGSSLTAEPANEIFNDFVGDDVGAIDVG
jgi:hypothetical protein